MQNKSKGRLLKATTDSLSRGSMVQLSKGGLLHLGVVARVLTNNRCKVKCYDGTVVVSTKKNIVPVIKPITKMRYKVGDRVEAYITYYDSGTWLSGRIGEVLNNNDVYFVAFDDNTGDYLPSTGIKKLKVAHEPLMRKYELSEPVRVKCNASLERHGLKGLQDGIVLGANTDRTKYRIRFSCGKEFLIDQGLIKKRRKERQSVVVDT